MCACVYEWLYALYNVTGVEIMDCCDDDEESCNDMCNSTDGLQCNNTCNITECEQVCRKRDSAEARLLDFSTILKKTVDGVLVRDDNMKRKCMVC